MRESSPSSQQKKNAPFTHLTSKAHTRFHRILEATHSFRIHVQTFLACNFPWHTPFSPFMCMISPTIKCTHPSFITPRKHTKCAHLTYQNTHPSHIAPPTIRTLLPPHFPAHTPQPPLPSPTHPILHHAPSTTTAPSPFPSALRSVLRFVET